jgi:hypothetical protein
VSYNIHHVSTVFLKHAECKFIYKIGTTLAPTSSGTWYTKLQCVTDTSVKLRIAYNTHSRAHILVGKRVSNISRELPLMHWNCSVHVPWPQKRFINTNFWHTFANIYVNFCFVWRVVISQCTRRKFTNEVSSGALRSNNQYLYSKQGRLTLVLSLMMVHWNAPKHVGQTINSHTYFMEQSPSWEAKMS